jgi:KaiC/GvpD/RAD55 family RecA-like ATPase
MEITRRVLETVGTGDSVLCHGPPLSGKRDFLAALLDGATNDGHPTVFLTTDENAEGLLSRYPDAFADRSGIVDCHGSSAPETPHTVRTVGRPPITGIAVAVSKVLEDVGASDRPPMIVVDSLTTLSLYSSITP